MLQREEAPKIDIVLVRSLIKIFQTLNVKSVTLNNSLQDPPQSRIRIRDGLGLEVCIDSSEDVSSNENWKKFKAGLKMKVSMELLK